MRAMPRLMMVLVMIMLSASVYSQISSNCNGRLNGFLCQGCLVQDAGVTSAYKIGPGGIGGACQQCLNVFCGQVPNIADPIASKNEMPSNCPRAPSDAVINNAVVDSGQLLEIAETNPYVAVAVFGQQYHADEMNPAGLGGTTSFTKALGVGDIQTLILNPLADVGGQMPDSTGVLVEALVSAETPATITYEYRATQLSMREETRTPVAPRVRLTFQRKPVQSRIVGQAPAFTYNALRLVQVASEASR